MNTKECTKRFDLEVSKLVDSNARKRLSMLFDNGTFNELDRFVKNNGSECEVVTAFGEVCGLTVYAYAQSVDINGGAMGKVQAAKIAHVYELATATGAPVVAVFDSNGAHIDEGVEALEAYGSLIKAAGNISGVVPQISVVAGACVGSAAVLATLSDAVIVTEDAELYITPSADCKDAKASVVAAKNGTAAVLCKDDKAAMEKAAELISYLPSNNLSEPLYSESTAPAGDGVIEELVDAGSFSELYCDYGKCIKVGFAKIGGASVGIVFTDADANGGYFCANGAKKAARFVRLCDSFSIPVITLVNALGVCSENGCEAGEEVKATALLTSAYSEATTPKVTVVTGNAVGGAYISFVSSAAAPDFVFAWPESVIGALEPMTAVQLLYKDRMLAGEKRSELEAEYAFENCSPFNAAALGLVSDVISKEETPAKVISALEVLASKRVSTLNKKHTNLPL